MKDEDDFKTVAVEISAANRKRLRLAKANDEGATYKAIINKALEEYFKAERRKATTS